MKQSGQLSFVKLRTDNAQHPGNGGRPPADFAFARNQIEMQPGSIRAGNKSLCAQNRAGYRALSDLIQRLAQLVLCIDMRCLNAPAGKDLVRIMSVMMVVMVMMAALAFLILVVMMAAFAFLIMIVMLAALALFIMVVVMTALAFLIMVVMMAAFTFLIMVMVMAALAFFILVMVMTTLAFLVVIVMMAALTFLIVIVVMATLAFFIMVVVMRQTIIFLHQLLHQFLLFHRFQNLRAADRIPWGRNNDRLQVLFPDQRQAFRQLFFA